jgi:hypothetical protein
LILNDFTSNIFSLIRDYKQKFILQNIGYDCLRIWNNSMLNREGKEAVPGAPEGRGGVVVMMNDE